MFLLLHVITQKQEWGEGSKAGEKEKLIQGCITNLAMGKA